MQHREKKKVLYITATLPALTVTFIYKEIYRLRDIGVRVDAVSMNTPRPDEISEESRPMVANTEYLDQATVFRKVLAFTLQVMLHPIRALRCTGIIATAKPMQGIRDYLRLSYHFIEAGYLCRHLDMGGYKHIHAHFINGPTSIAMFLAELSGVPFSFTMHASMIWLDPIAFRNKLDRCRFCASISQYNKDYVVGEYGSQYESKIQIIHCGIDPELKAVATRPRRSNVPVRLLGVGQLNRRKGFHILLQSCRILRDAGIEFSCTVVGGGSERESLENLRSRLQLNDHVHFTGPVKHEAVDELIAECDIFVLPCVISEDGWRDGIPVALMEAMFHRKTAISSRILGLPELIEDGVDGRLVEANNPQDLANTISELAASPNICTELAEKGRDKVLREFNNLKSANALAELFSAP